MTTLQENMTQPQPEVRVERDWAPPEPRIETTAGGAPYVVGDGARRAVRDFGTTLERLADES